jgi:5-deoxy-glucuronate isomerase
MTIPHAIAPGTCVVRDTAARKGRTRAVEPGPTASRHLHYGRIILAAGDPLLRFSTMALETGLICLRGGATVKTGHESHALTRFDALYVPRDSDVEVTAGAEGCDLAEIAAPVARRRAVQFVSFAAAAGDPSLHFTTGGDATRREISVLIGKNVDAGRIMAGVTFSQPGNWTSWPPHEHAAMLEEAYLYIEMPPPSFGIQLVYANSREPELATIVREGDIVLMPQGYHPNVAAPGGAINFVWMMAANREDVDRQYGVVNVQPDFAALGSGLDAARSKRP